MAKRKQENKDESLDNKKKKEADEVGKWLHRIEFAERYRKKIAEKYKWRQLTEEYKGYFPSIQFSNDIYIPAINLMFAYVKTEIPALYLRDPKIKINPKNGSSILSAKILEKAVNYLWRTKKIKRENKKNIQDTLTVSHSWFKTGYTGKFGSIEDDNGNHFEFIESEDFFGYHIPFENVVFNPDSNDPPFDCSWIAHAVWIPIDEVKNNKKYRHTEDLQGTQQPDEHTTDVNRSLDEIRRMDPDVQKVKIYEIWDKISKTVFTVSPGCEYFLEEPKKWPYKMKGFPFSFLRFNVDPQNPYGIPDMFMFESQVLELIKLRAAELDHLKRFNRQLLMAEGHMSDDAKAQFTQGITGAVIPVRTDNRPLDDIVKPIQYPPLQTDIYALEQRLKEDLLNVSGQTAWDRGATQQTPSRSVREMLEVQDGSQNRRSEKIDTVEDFIEDIASNLVALLQQFADVPYFVKLIGENPDDNIDGLDGRPSAKKNGAITTKSGFTFTKEDIQGEFDFEVVGGSTTPLNQANTYKILTEMAAMAVQVGAQPGGPFIQAIGRELADQVDMPVLKAAILEEQKQAAATKAEIQANQDKMTQLTVAQTGAELQLKATREATKQNQVAIQGLDVIAKHHLQKDQMMMDNAKEESAENETQQ